jgi:hypothetical protein
VAARAASRMAKTVVPPERTSNVVSLPSRAVSADTLRLSEQCAGRGDVGHQHGHAGRSPGPGPNRHDSDAAVLRTPSMHEWARRTPHAADLLQNRSGESKVGCEDCAVSVEWATAYGSTLCHRELCTTVCVVRGETRFGGAVIVRVGILPLGSEPGPGRDRRKTRSNQLNSWRVRRSNGLPLTLVILSTVLVVGLGFTSVAAAAPPTRQPNELPTEPFIFTDTLGNNPCSFPVLLEITTNKEVVTTFTRRSGVTSIHTTGALKVELTNTATGKSIRRNISGPILATVNPDGSITQIGVGLSLWVFDPGVAPELPRLALTSGRTVSILGPGTAFRFISLRGTYEDICAALGP